MAEIQPFAALHFSGTAGKLEELVCPPYDVISPEERSAYLARNPHNIIRLELPGTGEAGYREAGGILERWMSEESLVRDSAPALYVYEEEFTHEGQRRRIRGVTCRVRLQPFSDGVILPHEETLSKAKDDRFQLMKATDCNFSSVYALYSDKEGRIYPQAEAACGQEADMDFTTGDGIRHRVWRICDDQTVAAVASAFGDKQLYIADGHHRYETALRYRQYLRDQGVTIGEDHPANYIMMTLVNMEHPGLVVLPTHRVVHSLEDFSPIHLVRACSKYFDLQTVAGEDAQAAVARAPQHSVVLCHEDGCTLLTLKDPGIMDRNLPGKSPAYRHLSVSVLHTLILEEVLGIDGENMADQQNLTYTRDARAAIDAVERGQAQCAFLLAPTKVAEIAAVAEAGEKMPQKSTYFYPKLITGHLMNRIL